MNLPFDFEDVVGVALADTLRRAALIFGVVTVATTSAVFGLTTASLVGNLVGGVLSFDAPGAGIFFIVFLPLLTGWGILYLPLLLGVAFHCVKAEATDPRKLAGCAAAAAVLQILALAGVDADGWESWLEAGFAAVVAVGCGACLGFLAFLWTQRQQRRAEEHFMAVAVEIERRREEMELRNVGIVLDDPEAAD